MLSSAALLACGFLVFGRPLSTQREKRDWMPTTPAYNIASAGFSPDTTTYSPGALLSEDNLRYLTGMDVNFNLASSSPVGSSTSTALQKDFQPNTGLDIALSSQEALNTSPISPDVESEGLTTFGTFPSPDTQPDPPVDTKTVSNTEAPIMLAINGHSTKTLAYPENFEEDLRSIEEYRFVYCIYQLSLDNTRLVLQDCEESPDWGVFSQAFDRSTRGFAVYRLKDDSIDSIMKVSNRCRTASYGPDRFTLLSCGKEEVTNLKKFTDWEYSLQDVFPNKWKSIDATWTLAAIGNLEGAL